jgi:hypothetical protein
MKKSVTFFRNWDKSCPQIRNNIYKIHFSVKPRYEIDIK